MDFPENAVRSEGDVDVVGKSEETQVVMPGEKDLYEPLCRQCYNKAINKQK